jgi:hypothetical protein
MTGPQAEPKPTYTAEAGLVDVEVLVTCIRRYMNGLLLIREFSSPMPADGRYGLVAWASSPNEAWAPWTMVDVGVRPTRTELSRVMLVGVGGSFWVAPSLEVRSSTV